VQVFKLFGSIALDGVSTVNTQVGSLDKAFSGLGTKIIAAFGIGKLISEFKGFMGDALKSVQDYEGAMSRLRDVVSPQVAGSLGEAMRELSTKMPLSVTDLLAVNEVAGKLGIDGAENITTFTTAVGQISIVTGQQATAVAEDLGKIITQAGADVAVAEGLGSAISTLADTTNTKSDEILVAMTKVTGPFTQLGATLPDIAALSTQMLSITANGKEAATALRGIADAVKDPAKVHDFAVALGMTNDEFVTMRDTDVVGLIGQMATELAEGGTNADILRAALGNSAGPLETLGKRWDEVQKSMGLANQEYRTSEGLQTDYADRTNTITTKLQLLRQKFDDIKLGVGEALVPAIGNIAKAFDDNKKSIETFFTTLGTGVANTLVWLISNKDAVVAAIAGIAVAFALVKIASIASDAQKLITALNPLNLAMVGIAGLAALMANRFMDAAKDAAKIRAEAKRAADEAAQAQKDAARREFLQTHTAEQLAPQREQANQIIASYRQTTPMPAGGEMYAAQYRYLDFVPSGADAEAVRQRMNALSASIRANLGEDAVAIDAIIRDLEESAQVALSGAEGTGLAVFEEMAGKVIGTYSELLPDVAAVLDAIPPKVAAVAAESGKWEKAMKLFGKRIGEMFAWTADEVDKDGKVIGETLGEMGQLSADVMTGIFQGVAQSYLDQEGAAEAHQKAMDDIAAQEKASQDEAAAARDKELADIQDKYNKKLISQEEYNAQTTAANQTYTDAQAAASAARVAAEETEKTAYKETHKTLVQVLWDSAKAVLKALKNDLAMKAAAALAEAIALALGLNPLAAPKFLEAAAYGAGAAGLAVTGFEEGGLVKAGHPVYGVIGEGGVDEAVIPLTPSNLRQIGDAVAKAAARQGGAFSPEMMALGSEYASSIDAFADYAQQASALQQQLSSAIANGRDDQVASLEAQRDALYQSYEADILAYSEYLQKKVDLLDQYIEDTVSVPGVGTAPASAVMPFSSGEPGEHDIAVPGVGYVYAGDIVPSGTEIVYAEKRKRSPLQQFFSQLGRIFGFASGGVVSGPTFGMIGEGAVPEAVLPLSAQTFAGIGRGIAQAMSNPSFAMAGGIQVDMRGLYDGATINVRDDQDIRKIAKETFDLYKSRMLSRGYAV
jgi:TP901 family phage tail tape measure protein